MISTKGIPLGIEFAGGTVGHRAVRQAVSVEQVRAALDQNFGGENAVVQHYGDPSQHQVMIRVPEVGAEAGARSSATADAGEQALQAAGLGEVRRSRHARSSARPSAQELRPKGTWATVLSLVGILALHRVPLPVQLRGRRGGRDHPRPAGDARVPGVLPVRHDAERDRRDADDHRLLDQRHHRHLRPRPREPPRRCAATRSTTCINLSVNQTLGRTIITSGTALCRRAGALPVRRRRAARLRVHDDRRDHHRHVFDHLHRGRDCRDLARQGAAQGGGPARRPPAPTAPQQPTRKSKPQRKARAS